MSANGRGAVWIVLSTVFFTGQAVGVKSLAGQIHSMEIVFFRLLLGGLFILPFAVRHGGLRTKRPGLHLSRGVAGVAAMSCMYYAVTKLPLADVTAIAFTKALFTVVLAVLVLRETVGWRRWSATAAGFAGVLLMVRPGFGTFEPAVGVALLGAFLVATVVTLIKKLSETERPSTIIVYFSTVGALLTLGPALLVWRTPSGEELLILALLTLSGTIAQALGIRGWAVGEASAMAPIGYAQLLFAALFGFVLFSEVPDAWTIAGAAVIVASTLYIARRESLKGRPPTAKQIHESAPAE